MYTDIEELTALEADVRRARRLVRGGAVVVPEGLLRAMQSAWIVWQLTDDQDSLVQADRLAVAIITAAEAGQEEHRDE